MGDSRPPSGGSSLLPQVEVNGYGHRSIASLSRGNKKGEDGCRDCSETEDVNKANLGRLSFPREGGEWHGRGEILVFHRRANIKESVPKERRRGQVRSNEEVASVSQDGGTLSKGPFPSNLVVLDKAFISVHKDEGHISLGVPKHAGVDVESNELGSSVRASS